MEQVQKWVKIESWHAVLLPGDETLCGLKIPALRAALSNDLPHGEASCENCLRLMTWNKEKQD